MKDEEPSSIYYKSEKHEDASKCNMVEISVVGKTGREALRLFRKVKESVDTEKI